MEFVARFAGLSCSVYNSERMMICAKLSLGAISAINRTVFKLPFPNYSFTKRAWAVLLLWCGSSVLHVIMSVCMFGAVQFLNVFILNFNSSERPIHLFQQW